MLNHSTLALFSRRSAVRKLPRNLFVIIGQACLAIDAAAQASLSSPLHSRNLTPVQANLGIPLMESAAGLEAGRWALNSGLHWASHSLRDRDGAESLEFDGETRRLDLKLALGLGKGFTVTANLPYVEHSGGSLDSLIDGWHGLWGMPDGARDDQRRDQLRFALEGNSGFNLEDDASGIGDAEIGLAWRFREIGSSHWSAFGQYKFATGEANDFTGSGDHGYALGLRFSSGDCLWSTLSCHLQAGMAAVGDIEFAANADARVGFAGLSLAWAVNPGLALIAQLEAQENPYRSGVLNAEGDPIWGTLGLRWLPAPGWHLECQFSEDLNVGSAPDVTFRLALGHAW